MGRPDLPIAVKTLIVSEHSESGARRRPSCERQRPSAQLRASQVARRRRRRGRRRRRSAAPARKPTERRSTRHHIGGGPRSVAGLSLFRYALELLTRPRRCELEAARFDLKPLANWPTPQDLRPHERDILVTADSSGSDSPVPSDSMKLLSCGCAPPADKIRLFPVPRIIRKFWTVDRREAGYDRER